MSLLEWLQERLAFSRMSPEEIRAEQARILANVPVPVFWLFGKAGSGKTSVVRYLTGAETAEIGTGYRPQTQNSLQYDFPSPDAPLLRFLDTRGLGESLYDPSEDLRRFRDSTHVMIVTARVTDQALSAVIEPLRQIRREQPQRPVLLLLTRLHEAYPGRQHSAAEWMDMAETTNGADGTVATAALPPELLRCIDRQKIAFAGLVDRIVPIDLTLPEDGFDEPAYGGPRLKAALVAMLPAAYRHTLLTLDDQMQSLRELNERRAFPYILGYSSLAATAGAVPIPWVDIPVVIGIQSQLVWKLADLYGQRVDARALMGMIGPVGARLLTRLLLRGTLKFIPYLGSAANAAAAFAYTYGLGKACCWYFGRIRHGDAPTAEALEQEWQEQLLRAKQMWTPTTNDRSSPP
jgi:uncharacterized protein (DUF697 family)/predicted GTPase